MLLLALLALILRAGARCSSGSPSAPVDGGRSGPKGRAHDARAFAVSARMRCRRTPADVHAPAGQDARRAVLWGCRSLWFLSLGQARERNRPAGMRDEPTGMWTGFREAVGPDEHKRKDTAKAPSPCPLPQAGEGKAKGMRNQLTRTWTGFREEATKQRKDTARAPSPRPLPQAGEGKPSRDQPGLSEPPSRPNR